MAIETSIQISSNCTIQSAYVKVSNPRSFKAVIKEENKPDSEVLKLVYDIESYSECDGVLLPGFPCAEETNYQSGDIWKEAYEHLKTNYKDYKDV